MGNYYPGRISFPERYLEDKEIKKQVEDYFYDNNGEIAADDYGEEDGIMWFEDDQARDGCFDTLEELLESKQLPYDRWSAAYDEDSVMLYYRPDLENSYIYCDGAAAEREFGESDLRKLAEGVTDMAELGKRFKDFLDKFPKIKLLEDYA